MFVQTCSRDSNPLTGAAPQTVYEIVPEEHRPHYHGAKLVPLVKNDKALLPITCSEETGQIGVAVSSGLEALVSFTRQAALVLASDAVFVKVPLERF